VRPVALVPEPDPASTRWEHAAHAPVLVVTGCIDAVVAPRLSAAICTYGRDSIVLDLDSVHLIEPSALRDVLLAARIVGIALHVVCPTAAPSRSAFRLARLVQPVSIHESRADALAAAYQRLRPAV
jgi:hypothetical protein